MSGQIFISYRREESRWSARSLHDRLCRSFDEAGQIFMDIDGIRIGADFVDVIESTVAKCDVLIAVIGNNWLTTNDGQGGRRLDNPEDFVRMEIATALKRNIHVIPVLVDNAAMPRSSDLPEDLKRLARRNALRITDVSFDSDCQRLAAEMKLVLDEIAKEAQQREKDRLDVENRAREETQRQEAETLEAQRLENERLLKEQREKAAAEEQQRDKERLEAENREREEKERQESDRLTAQRLEIERLANERREKERLETEQHQREDAGVPPSPAPSQDRMPAQAETTPIVQSQASENRKPFSIRAPVVGVVLLSIVGAIWLAGSMLQSSDPTFYSDRGWHFYTKGDYDKAISDYNEAIRLDPNNALAYRRRGIAHYDHQEYDKAISDYNEAIREDPSYAGGYCDRGIAYYQKKDYDKAISDYTESIRLDPNDGRVYSFRGQAYRAQGKASEAQADFDKAKQLGYGPE